MSLTLLDGITIGAFGGASAGLIVWFVQWRKEKLADWLDKRKIYNWLYEDAKKTNKLIVSSAMDVRWMPTENIACFTNLPKSESDIYAVFIRKLYQNCKLIGWAVLQMIVGH